MLNLELQHQGCLAEALDNPQRYVNVEEPRKAVNVRIVRNWPAEPVANKMMDFGQLVGLNMAIELSPYSDSLILEKVAKDTFEVCVIWLDEDRLSKQALDEIHRSAIDIARSRPHVAFCMLRPEGSGELQSAPTNLTLSYYKETKTTSESALKYGHRFASPAYIKVLRDVSIAILPNALFGTYRLIAVDFDNTLYDGVLAEDSPSGIKFSKDRVALIRKLSELARHGCLIFGITKNEPEDIDYLLETSEKYGLSRDLFWKVSASWKSKPEQLFSAIHDANLDPSMVLFLDDNILELEQMSVMMPQVDLLSTQDPKSALAALESGHRLPNQHDPNWSTRVSDLKNRNLRIAKNAMTLIELHRKLGSRVTSRLLSPNDLTRAQEIIQKTNQFNLSLRRSDLGSVYGTDGHIIANSEVSDRLGSSGIVGVLVAKQNGSLLIVQEFCISCRVLGRGLESAMFFNMISASGVEFEHIRLNWSRGHRNQPSLDWVSEFGPNIEGESGWIDVSYDEFSRQKEDPAYRLVCE